MILYLLKWNKAVFSMTAEEKEELETRKKRLLYLLVLILLFAIFLFSSVIVIKEISLTWENRIVRKGDFYLL